MLEPARKNIVLPVRPLPRTLIYVLFVLAIFYLFSLRAQRSRTVELAQIPLVFLEEKSYQGQVVFKRRADGSEYLVLKLNHSPPQEMIVLLTDKEGLSQEIGRFKGATFIISLPPAFFYEKLKKVELKEAREGKVWAEALLDHGKSPAMD